MSSVLKSHDELTEAIARVLEDWPLYRRFEYEGRSLHSYTGNGTEHGDLPSAISLHCEICGAKQWWRFSEGKWGTDVYFGRGPAFVTYVCRNCCRSEVYFTL